MTEVPEWFPTLDKYGVLDEVCVPFSNYLKTADKGIFRRETYVVRSGVVKKVAVLSIFVSQEWGHPEWSDEQRKEALTMFLNENGFWLGSYAQRIESPR